MSHVHPLGEVELSNEQYHAGPGISKSKLDAIAISPLNYWDQYVNPNAEPREEKHCFIVGDGTHKLVLEPGTFEQTYAVGFDRSAFPDALDTVDDLKRELSAQMLMTSGTKPELARRLVEEGGFPRERVMMFLKADHEARMAGKVEIPARDYANMLGMLQGVQRDTWASGLLRGATVERSFFHEMEVEYVDPATGEVEIVQVLVKCRPDAISWDGKYVLDLKTTDDVSAKGFGRTILQRRYHVQAAFYLDILRGLYGSGAPQGFAFIPVQKTRPHDVSVQGVPDAMIERGRELYMRDLRNLIHCHRTGIWPGVSGGKPLTAELPTYGYYD